MATRWRRRQRCMETDHDRGPAPLWLDVLGWYGTLAIVGAYFSLSHGLLEEGVAYHMLNLTGALGVGAVCWWKRAWQPMSLEVVWCLIAISALF